MKPKRVEPEYVDGPAKELPGHQQDIPTSPAIGAPKRWRKLSPLQSAYEKGQLTGGNPKYLAQDRLEAGLRYSGLYLTAHGSGRNILDPDHIPSKGGSTTLSEAVVASVRSLVSIESHMSARDRAIIRAVCGEEQWPSEAVRNVCGDDYRFTVLARFREALDSLIEASETARRRPGSFGR